MDPAERRPPAGHVGGSTAAIRALAALGIQWPGRRVAVRMARAGALAMAHCTTRAGEPNPDVAADELARMQYLKAYGAALNEARALFAEANGWRLARSPFSAQQLCTGRLAQQARDYAAPSWAELLGIAPPWLEYFRDSRQRPVAVVVHAEGPAALASIQGLTQLPLPVSWHFPAGGVAYLLTTAPR